LKGENRDSFIFLRAKNRSELKIDLSRFSQRDWLEHPVFLQAMIKFPAWQEGDDEVVFPQITAFTRS
jgi:hypothetical protein